MNYWVLWALLLMVQNLTFTFVSRARASASLRRHVIAAVGSNGVWILQLQIMLGPLMEYLNGKHGLLLQIAVGAYYTVFTVTGSVVAHYISLKTEKGKAAVGANTKYAQITTEEWKRVREFVEGMGGDQYE
jgi:hypothetical protein